MKVVINKCFGGFGLSEAAYRKLIELGIPVRKYTEEVRDPETGLFKTRPLNESEVIFDRSLEPGGSPSLSSERYWDCWTRCNRTHPLLVRVVEQLGEEANGPYAKLAIVDIPDDVEFTIEQYHGFEHVAEVHRTWG